MRPGISGLVRKAEAIAPLPLPGRAFGTTRGTTLQPVKGSIWRLILMIQNSSLQAGSEEAQRVHIDLDANRPAGPDLSEPGLHYGLHAHVTIRFHQEAPAVPPPE